jgi:hypothetical protein
MEEIFFLIMEAAGISETWINLYQTARRNTPEDSHLHSYLHEKLKSHQIFLDVKTRHGCRLKSLFTFLFDDHN